MLVSFNTPSLEVRVADAGKLIALESHFSNIGSSKAYGNLQVPLVQNAGFNAIVRMAMI